MRHVRDIFESSVESEQNLMGKEQFLQLFTMFNHIQLIKIFYGYIKLKLLSMSLFTCSIEISLS